MVWCFLNNQNLPDFSILYLLPKQVDDIEMVVNYPSGLQYLDITYE
jgi:hypothetical protein